MSDTSPDSPNTAVMRPKIDINRGISFALNSKPNNIKQPKL